MKWFYTGLLILCFSSSCKESKRDSLTQLVNEWDGKKIAFPSDMSFVSYGSSEAIKCDITYEKYAVITYVDSLGCVSCKLQLPGWDKFLYELDSVSDGSVPCLFFFHPKQHDRRELIGLLKRTHFTYPVCIDENDSLNILNQFPSDLMFQTFLLNKNNRVIAMGNPVYNPKIKELYLKIIKGEDPVQSQKNLQTSIAIDKSEIDWSTFNWKQEQVTDVILTNTGNELLVIEGISTSCGCTTVEYSKEPVQPDKNLALKVKYKADHPEHFNKTITVYCNAKGSPFKLQVSGNAE